jgi:hypothetical protein
MLILINKNRIRYHPSIHGQIQKEITDVEQLMKRNGNLGHHVSWGYRDDDGGERKDPGAYLTVVIHPVVGVYWNSDAVKFLLELEKTRKVKAQIKKSKGGRK